MHRRSIIYKIGLEVGGEIISQNKILLHKPQLAQP